MKLPVCRPWARNVYWMYGVQLMDNDRFTKDRLMVALKNEGIDTRSFFYPLNIQKAYQKYGKQDCPNAESLGKRGFYLPSGQTFTINQIHRVAETLSKLLRK